jgi:hypothetical protein
MVWSYGATEVAPFQNYPSSQLSFLKCLAALGTLGAADFQVFAAAAGWVAEADFQVGIQGTRLRGI